MTYKADTAQPVPLTAQIGSPWITAEVAPDYPAGEPARVTISWDGGDEAQWEVWVSRDGFQEGLFAVGPAGTQNATWVELGSVYDFELCPPRRADGPAATARVVIGVEPSQPPSELEIPAVPLGDGGPKESLLVEPDALADGTAANTEHDLSSRHPVEPSLSVEPTSFTWSPDPATVTVTWVGMEREPCEVWVAKDGIEVGRFAVGSSGSKEASWIQEGRYEFWLHRPGRVGPPLAMGSVVMEPPPTEIQTADEAPSVAEAQVEAESPVALEDPPAPLTVVAPKTRPAFIAAAPNPIPPQPGLGSTTLLWDTGDGSYGLVVLLVRRGGEEHEAPFAEGAAGAQEVSWIGAGVAYRFRLYRHANYQPFARDGCLAETTISMGEEGAQFAADVATLLVGIPTAVFIGSAAVAQRTLRSIERRLRKP